MSAPPTSSTEAVQPFTVDIPSVEVDRLIRKLHDTRHPTHDVVPETGWDYGVPTNWALSLLHYWLNEFSWPRAQERINKLTQFKTEIEGQTIHFVHQRSPRPDAIPILLLHGWPGSFYEFSEVIGPLCNPQAEQQAFHCVAPSLPGFCFSSSPQRKGWTVADTARVLNKLMLRLGHTQYCVQAGDWGQFVARELGANEAYSSACKLIHLNYCPGALPEGASPTERERAAAEKGADWRTNHVGYAVLMRTRPQSLGWMLEDNPIGLLSFVGEKYHEASNPAASGTAEWMHHVLTTVCLYYFTNCITSSALVYYENMPHHEFATFAMARANHIRCPFGYTSFWFDTAPNSRRAVERTGNLVFYCERDYAGHFAALEDPKGICADVRELVKGHWPRES